MTPPNDPRGGLPSASAFERVVRCPGSPRLLGQIPWQELDTTDELADRGTRIHRAFQTGNTLELDEDEEAAYKAGVRFTDLLVDRWKEDFGIIHQQEGEREERLWYHHPETLDVLGSAQLDRYYLAPPRAIIIDLKSGWGTHVTPSPRNLQLRLQALCLWRSRDDIRHIRVAFARAMSKVGVSDYADYEESDLWAAEASVLQAFWEAQQEDAPLRAGDHCRYCPGKAFCEAAQAHAMLPSVIARQAAANIADKEDARIAVSGLSLADVVRVWDISRQVGWILDAVEARLKGLTPEDLLALGLEKAPGRKLDPITDVQGAIKHLALLGWDETEIWGLLSLSKTDLGKLARKYKGFTSDARAAQWIARDMAQFITEKRGEGWIRRIKG